MQRRIGSLTSKASVVTNVTRKTFSELCPRLLMTLKFTNSKFWHFWCGRTFDLKTWVRIIFVNHSCAVSVMSSPTMCVCVSVRVVFWLNEQLDQDFLKPCSQAPQTNVISDSKLSRNSEAVSFFLTIDKNLVSYSCWTFQTHKLNCFHGNYKFFVYIVYWNCVYEERNVWN